MLTRRPCPKAEDEEVFCVQALRETGATGLEPATSAVTGRSAASATAQVAAVLHHPKRCRPRGDAASACSPLCAPIHLHLVFPRDALRVLVVVMLPRPPNRTMRDRSPRASLDSFAREP